MEQKLSDLKGVIQTASAEDLKPKMEALSEALQKVGAAMYKDQKTQNNSEQPEGQTAGEPEKTEETPKTEEAVEGEVVEESGDKNG